MLRVCNFLQGNWTWWLLLVLEISGDSVSVVLLDPAPDAGRRRLPRYSDPRGHWKFDTSLSWCSAPRWAADLSIVHYSPQQASVLCAQA